MAECTWFYLQQIILLKKKNLIQTNLRGAFLSEGDWIMLLCYCTENKCVIECLTWLLARWQFFAMLMYSKAELSD